MRTAYCTYVLALVLCCKKNRIKYLKEMYAQTKYFEFVHISPFFLCFMFLFELRRRSGFKADISLSLSMCVNSLHLQHDYIIAI